MEHQKDITTKEQKDTLKTKDALCRYVFLKTQKLTSALYMVTDFLSDNEPLKWKLREFSLNIVSESNLLFRDKKDFFGVAGLNRISGEISDLINLLDVAYVGGAVSQMNFGILKQEYQTLLNLIEEQTNESSFKKFISDEVFSIYPTLSAGSVPTPTWAQNKFSHPSNSNSFRLNQLSVKNTVGKNSGQPSSHHIGQKDTKNGIENDLYGLNSKTEKKSLRKEQIINFLKDKSWTGIAEIAKSLPDCGAKTVQRELLEMVSLGILKKQGERRWSRYMLI